MTEATTSAEQTEAPTITLQDLQNLLQIVDVSAERGTFRGGELTSVGAVRDKLSAFLNAAKQAEEAAAEGSPDAEGAESDTSSAA